MTREDGTGEVRIAIVDDHPLFGQGLAAWISEHRPDLSCEYLGCDPTATAAAEPALVLLDIDLGPQAPPAADTVQQLAEAGIPVILVSALQSGPKVRQALLAGAVGYVAKARDPLELVAAIDQALTGKYVLTRELAELMCSPPPPDLSARELCALRLYAQGFPLKTVARQMSVSVSTAKEYLDRVRSKYEAVGRPARTKIELGNVAREDGLLDDDP